MKSVLALSISYAQRTGFAVLVTALTLGVCIPRATAQLTLGTITGNVRDPASAAVEGASVSLISETLGTRLLAVKSVANGDFVLPNVPPDTYTLEITHAGFKTLRRTGVAVSPGDRVGLGTLGIEIGAASESVTVTAEATMLQTQSGERSYTVRPSEVQNLPLASRIFTNLAGVAPGVSGTNRMGDTSSYLSGDSNIMMDGVSTMDTGNNAAAIAVNTESIAEVKILVSSYQAEYGRSSGLQISAVTKSGSNRFHGTGFLIMRQSGWNANSKTNILNGGIPKAYSRQKDLGFTVGGPIGKPGHQNKLFFFYSHEFDPRSQTIGGTIVNYRVPTALERQGDFSKTTDNRSPLADDWRHDCELSRSNGT
jgi:hypothetical protein